MVKSEEIDDAKAETPDPYYKELVGEVFKGTYIGDFMRGDAIRGGDSTARQWKEVKIDGRTTKPKMKAGLKQIEERFEGRIWKGLRRRILYVNPDRVQRDLFVKGTKKAYKIKQFETFDFSAHPKTRGKYTENRGYYFILTDAEDTAQLTDAEKTD